MLRSTSPTGSATRSSANYGKNCRTTRNWPVRSTLHRRAGARPIWSFHTSNPNSSAPATTASTWLRTAISAANWTSRATEGRCMPPARRSLRCPGPMTSTWACACRSIIRRSGGTVEQRRAAYLGSLGIAFSVPKLLHGVMDEIPIAGLRMTLYDIGPGLDIHGHDTAGMSRTLFDSHGTAANPTPPVAGDEAMFSATLPSISTAEPGRRPTPRQRPRSTRNSTRITRS